VIEASFVTDEGKIIQRRMVDEDRLFESYRDGRVLHMEGHKVMVCGCIYLASTNLIQAEVAVKEVV
jgi:hypothetical protein